MRLVCPSCEAKYEVPDDAIPDTGRDVQCANCGHAWFQMRPRSAAAAETLALTDTVAPPADPVPDLPVAGAGDPEPGVAEDLTGPGPEDAVHAPVADSAPQAATEAVTEAATEAAQDVEVAADLAADLADAPEQQGFPATDAEGPHVEAVAEAPIEAGAAEAVDHGAAADAGDDSGPKEAFDPDATRPPSGYAVDESVLAILREEAEREAAARRAEVQVLETQPDLGIDSAPPLTAGAAKLEADNRPAARRDLFPDVEEINSTLRPEEFPIEEPVDVAAAAPPPQPRSGFRNGFLTVMTIAILAAALYIVAPGLGRLVPAIEGPLAGYVGAVDGLRAQLDGVMQSATLAINGN